MLKTKLILSILLICFVVFCICWLWISRQRDVKERYTPETFYENKKLDEISIVTYNIQKFPWSTKTFKELHKLLKKYSIILLQECFDETFVRLETYFPTYHICRGNLKGLTLMNSGLVILSKFPIVDVYFHQYQHSNPLTFDTFSEKGFLSALVNINGQLIYIINTHLQSCDFHRYDKYAILQLNELNYYLNGVIDKQYIVGADFNIDINDYSKIITKNKKNLYYPDTPTIFINFLTSHTRSSQKPGYEPLIFDYFISTIDLAKPTVLYSDYSDHNLVHTYFRL